MTLDRLKVLTMCTCHTPQCCTMCYVITYFINDMIFFFRYFSEPPPQQKTHSLEMLVQQNNRITTIASMIQDAKTEDASTKCNDAMGIEVAIKQIMEKYVELVFAKDVEEEDKEQQIALHIKVSTSITAVVFNHQCHSRDTDWLISRYHFFPYFNIDLYQNVTV